MHRPDVFRITTVAVLLAILGTGLAFLVLRASGPSGSLEILLPTATPPREGLVYVTGAVQRQGLYPARDGDRVSDVIGLAGGLTQDADPSRVNLAARVDDGDHIHVPRVGEPSLPAALPADQQLLNINTASQEELARLPGIGPTRARAIVAFRERNGGFQRVEDLLLVEGIGEVTLERIRALITTR